MGSLESISTFADRWNAGSVQGSSAPGTATGAPMAKAPNATQKDKLEDIKAAMSPLQQNTAQVHRLDTILFLPTDEAVYKVGSRYEQTANVYQDSDQCVERVYMYEVLGRFHLVNSLLPSLLLMPPNRDIRIVSVISPWYAAGLLRFDQISEPLARKTSKIYQPWTVVGAASLRWAVLASELQRRLDLLSEADTRPRSKLPGIDTSDVTTVPVGVLNSRKQRSHISSILVCPGFERHSQLGAFLGTVSPIGSDALLSCISWILFIILYPIFWIFGKSTSKAADAVEWATTARLASFSHSTSTQSARDDFLSNERSVESLKEWTGIEPGKLYREGRVVLPPLPTRFQNASDAADLWNNTEEQVKRIIGKSSGSAMK